MDLERIKGKLDELESYLIELEAFLPDDEIDYMELRTKRACEKTFELACETVIDVCNIIISHKGYGRPLDSKSSVNKLVENSLISKNLGERLQEMIGFRNLLVHRYGQVDDHQAFEHLKDELGDFFEFMETIEKLLEEQETEEQK